MATNAFQSNAFQTNAFQITGVKTAAVAESIAVTDSSRVVARVSIAQTATVSALFSALTSFERISESVAVSASFVAGVRSAAAERETISVADINVIRPVNAGSQPETVATSTIFSARITARVTDQETLAVSDQSQPTLPAKNTGFINPPISPTIAALEQFPATPIYVGVSETLTVTDAFSALRITNVINRETLAVTSRFKEALQPFRLLETHDGLRKRKKRDTIADELYSKAKLRRALQEALRESPHDLLRVQKQPRKIVPVVQKSEQIPLQPAQVAELAHLIVSLQNKTDDDEEAMEVLLRVL